MELVELVEGHMMVFAACARSAQPSDEQAVLLNKTAHLDLFFKPLYEAYADIHLLDFDEEDDFDTQVGAMPPDGAGRRGSRATSRGAEVRA